MRGRHVLCGYCGFEFFWEAPKGPVATYCSSQCRHAAARRQNRTSTLHSEPENAIRRAAVLAADQLAEALEALGYHGKASAVQRLMKQVTQ